MTKKVKQNLLNNLKATRIKVAKRKGSNLKIFWILIIGSLLLLLSSYIFQAGVMIQKTSLIKEYEKEVNYLVQQNKEFEVSFSKSNSLKSLEDSLEELEFEKVAQVEYIRVIDTAVAAK